MSDRVAVMEKGRILQIGTPRDIYNRPTSRFVADFIGDTNFLPGVAAAEGVRLGTGEVVRTATAGRSGAVTLAVRPEQVRLAAPDAAGALRATVTDLVYFGTDTHCHMALADGTPIVARLQSLPSGEVPAARGDAVGVTFAPDAVQILEA